MNKFKRLNGTCLIAATLMLHAPQVVMAEGDTTWGISGWINEGMTYYDDGDKSGTAQLSDNGTTLGSRITLSGDYEPPETSLKAGFEVILEVLSGTPNFAGGGSITPLLFANQDNLDTFNGGDIGVLGSSVHIGGGWGKITLGLQSMPTDNIAVLADPSGTIWSGISPVFRGNGFFIRGLGAGATNNTWGSFLQCLTTPGLGIGIDCNGVYRNGVRYDLPAFGDVNIAVGYANDEIYDIALKYATTFGDFTTNVNLGYALNEDGGTNVGGEEADVFQFQAGLMHAGTGLFGLVTYQKETADNATNGTGDDTDAYYFKFGIKKGWLGFGATALYVDYGLYNDQYGSGAGISGSEVQRFGLAAVQDYGKRLKIYGKWEQLSLDVDGTAAVETAYNDADDLDTFTLGVTYFF
ncbi:MAG: porin [Gammaproteobacteria bacterium]